MSCRVDQALMMFKVVANVSLFGRQPPSKATREGEKERNLSRTFFSWRRAGLAGGGRREDLKTHKHGAISEVLVGFQILTPIAARSAAPPAAERVEVPFTLLLPSPVAF